MEEGVDLVQISDVITGYSEVSLKLGHLGSDGKVLVFHCCQLRFARGWEVSRASS